MGRDVKREWTRLKTRSGQARRGEAKRSEAKRSEAMRCVSGGRIEKSREVPDPDLGEIVIHLALA